MRKRLLAAFVVAIICSWAAAAQEAQPILEQVARTLGADELKAIRYAGSGYSFALGQNYSPADPWPRFRLERYDRLVDYEQVASGEELIGTQAEDPPRGGGNQPVLGVQRQVYMMSGEYAWNEASTRAAAPEHGAGLAQIPSQSENPVPAPAAVADRQRQIWLTPHGFVKAARRAQDLTARLQTEPRPATIFSFSLEDGTPVTGAINEQNLLERVEIWSANPVIGDMHTEIFYLDYRDFGGVQFPTRILQVQGGFPTLEVAVSDVVPNPADHFETPAAARASRIEPPRVEVQPVAEGIWFLTGGSHNSVAVEFRDYVAVIEAPQDEARSVAVINEVHRLVPRKQIRFLINTHHHFDHSGGLRTYVAEGATILTHESNREFYEQIFETPRVILRDRLSRSGRPAQVETVTDRFLLRNGTRVMEILLVEGNLHDAGLLMVYLPRERLLVEADAYTPAPADAPPPATPSPFALNLFENIQRLKLDVTRIVPVHGRVVSWAEFLKAVGKQSQTPTPEGLLRATRDQA